MDTTATNLLLRIVRKMLVAWLAADMEKTLHDQQVTVHDSTSLVKVSDLNQLNGIPGLIEVLHIEMRDEIQQQHVCLLEVSSTLQSVREFEGCSVALIADAQNSLQQN